LAFTLWISKSQIYYFLFTFYNPRKLGFDPKLGLEILRHGTGSVKRPSSTYRPKCNVSFIAKQGAQDLSQDFNVFLSICRASQDPSQDLQFHTKTDPMNLVPRHLQILATCIWCGHPQPMKFWGSCIWRITHHLFSVWHLSHFMCRGKQNSCTF